MYNVRLSLGIWIFREKKIVPVTSARVVLYIVSRIFYFLVVCDSHSIDIYIDGVCWGPGKKQVSFESIGETI